MKTKMSHTRLFFLIFLSAQLAFISTAAFCAQAQSLKVAAVKFRVRSIDLDHPEILLNKFNTLLTRYSGADAPDLIVTPEYSLFLNFGLGYKLIHPIKAVYNSASKTYSINATDTNSQKLLNIINQVRNIARTSRVNIALATVPEIVNASDDSRLQGVNVIFNSMLIIDLNGEVVAVKRKTQGSDRWNTSTSVSDTSYIYQLTLNTSGPVDLSTRDGKSFRIFPIICAECDNSDLLEQAKSANADLLVKAENEGDCAYEKITQSIQDGVFDPARNGWNWMIRDVLFREYVQARDVLKPDRYLLVAEGAGVQGGIINLRDTPLPLANLAVTSDWVYGRIELRNDYRNFSFEGRVLDAQSGAPLKDARVYLYVGSSGDGLSSLSNANGYFQVDNLSALLDDTISCFSSLVGYGTEEIKLRVDTLVNVGYNQLNFQLKPNPQGWPMFRGNIARSGLNHKEQKLAPAVDTRDKFKLLWSYTAENSPYDQLESETSPVIYEGKVYMGIAASRDSGPNPGRFSSLKCFDLATGKILWEHPDAGGTKMIWSTPCIYNGKIYVAEFGNLYCYAADTGREIWRFFGQDIGERTFRASPLIVKDTLYIGTLGMSPANTFYALDANSGRIKASININGGIYGSPVVEGNRLYLAVINGLGTEQYSYVSLKSYDITNPDAIIELWRTNFDMNVGANSTPLIYQDYLYYSVGQPKAGSLPAKTSLFVLNRYTGQIVSRYDLSEASYSACITSPAIAYGNIYVCGYDSVYCLKLEYLHDNNPSTEPLLWSYKLPTSPPGHFINSSVTVANGYIYFGAGDVNAGSFNCLDAFSGKLVWSYDHNGQGMGYSLSSPAVAEGKVVFNSAHDFSHSGVYCFGNVGKPPASPAQRRRRFRIQESSKSKL
ncbi:MAG: PQQ-binding-like beta-propeller repeat protein [Candidatus Omnitrophota bacterium]